MIYSTLWKEFFTVTYSSGSKWCKGKAVLLQAWRGPEGARKLRFPDYMTTAQDGGKVVNLTHRPPLPPGNAPGTHFCQMLSQPQGHSAFGRILCQWKIHWPAGIEPATFQFVEQQMMYRSYKPEQISWLQDTGVNMDLMIDILWSNMHAP